MISGANLQKAAEILRDARTSGALKPITVEDTRGALALYRSGLLKTDQESRILDAVAHWRKQPNSAGALMRLMDESSGYSVVWGTE